MIKDNVKSESVLEKKTCEALTKLGCVCIKLSSPNRRGLPDRLIMMQPSIAFFIEFKSPSGNGRLTPLQDHYINLFKSMGFKAYVIGSVSSANELIQHVKHEITGGGGFCA